MNNLSFNFEKLKVSEKDDNTRICNDIINEFVKEINKEREGTKFRKVSFIAIRQKLYAIKDNPFLLQEFLKECRDYKHRSGSFSKYFFAKLKTNKE